MSVKKKNPNKWTNVVYALVFLLLMGSFGGVSIYNFIMHRVQKTAINEDYENAEDPLEAEFNGTFFLREELMAVQGKIAETVQEQAELNGVVKLTNGYLSPVMDALSEEQKEIWKEEAANIASLAKFFAEREIPFLYAATPDKIAPPSQDQFLPEGYEDYSNEHIDVFLEDLRENNVPVMDLREELYRVDPDHYRWFYKTDHHWTAEAGFYAFDALAEWLEKNTEIRIDPRVRDIEQYEEEVFPDAFLGTWGQRTGIGFAQPEDISLYVPKYPTDIRPVWWEDQGTLDEMLYQRNVIGEEPGDVYDDLFYDTGDFYNEGDTANGKTILLIGDSFSRTVNPFLLSSFANFYWYSCYASEGLDVGYINTIHPDAVILLQSGWNNYGSEDSFKYALSNGD